MAWAPYKPWHEPLDESLVQLFRDMTIRQKFALADYMTDDLKRFVYERLKQFHPEWSEMQLRREFLRFILGIELPPDMPIPE